MLANWLRSAVSNHSCPRSWQAGQASTGIWMARMGCRRLADDSIRKAPPQSSQIQMCLVLLFLDIVGVVVDIAAALARGVHAANRLPEGFPFFPLFQDLFAQLVDIAGGFRALPVGVGIIVRFTEAVVVQAGHGQDDTGVDVGKCAFDGIAAFQYGNISLEESGQFRIAAGGKVHIGDRVGVMIVLAGRIDDQFRFEIIQDGQDHLLDSIEKTFI